MSGTTDLNEDALIGALHEYRRCSEDQARGIITAYLALAASEEPTGLEKLADERGRSMSEVLEDAKRIEAEFGQGKKVVVCEQCGHAQEQPVAAREDTQCDEVEIVARHLAERDHGGSPRHGVEVCEGYKDEARVLLAQLAREDTERPGEGTHDLLAYFRDGVST